MTAKKQLGISPPVGVASLLHGGEARRKPSLPGLLCIHRIAAIYLVGSVRKHRSRGTARFSPHYCPAQLMLAELWHLEWGAGAEGLGTASARRVLSSSKQMQEPAGGSWPLLVVPWQEHGGYILPASCELCSAFLCAASRVLLPKELVLTQCMPFLWLQLTQPLQLPGICKNSSRPRSLPTSKLDPSISCHQFMSYTWSTHTYRNCCSLVKLFL